MTVTEAAFILKVSGARVRALLAVGTLKGRKDRHGFWSVTRASVEAYAASPRKCGKRAKRKPSRGGEGPAEGYRPASGKGERGYGCTNKGGQEVGDPL